jgi:hypothetical protein
MSGDSTIDCNSLDADVMAALLDECQSYLSSLWDVEIQKM